MALRIYLDRFSDREDPLGTPQKGDLLSGYSQIGFEFGSIISFTHRAQITCLP